MVALLTASRELKLELKHYSTHYSVELSKVAAIMVAGLGRVAGGVFE